MKYLINLILVFILYSCESADPNAVENRIKIPATSWRFTLNLNGDILPFNGSFSKIKSHSATLTLKNGEEEIIIKDVKLQNDSVIVPLPFFNTEMRLSIESPYMLSGVWVNLDKENYRIPLNAEQGQDFRFTNTGSDRVLPLRYMVKFELGLDSEYPAVLILKNNSGKLSGTFLTETGDYRYLEGNIMSGSIHLSTFDGSHAFLFMADISGDSLINGIFKSGKNYKADWMGVGDPNATLRDPEKITTFEKDNLFDFELPNQDGKMATWKNSDLEGKVVVLDIMGTWCPNCMDASRALKELSRPYSEDDLVVLPVLFEYRDDLKLAKSAFSEYSQKLNISEKFLFGGRASKKIANEKFPMLSSISSFPTLVFIGRDRQVAHVYTGFYGPSTGEYYTDFMNSKKKLLQSLVDSQ
jgi:thiol-disulfide isomerase/thioredoxin